MSHLFTIPFSFTISGSLIVQADDATAAARLAAEKLTFDASNVNESNVFWEEGELIKNIEADAPTLESPTLIDDQAELNELYFDYDLDSDDREEEIEELEEEEEDEDDEEANKPDPGEPANEPEKQR